jgi:hypothetical protein
MTKGGGFQWARRRTPACRACRKDLTAINVRWFRSQAYCQACFRVAMKAWILKDPYNSMTEKP